MIHADDKDRALAITTALYAVRVSTLGGTVSPKVSKDLINDAAREAAHILHAIARHVGQERSTLATPATPPPSDAAPEA
jgi:hypothetical protein